MKISTNGKGSSPPEYAYICAGICVGKKIFGSGKSFVSFVLQKKNKKLSNLIFQLIFNFCR